VACGAGGVRTRYNRYSGYDNRGPGSRRSGVRGVHDNSFVKFFFDVFFSITILWGLQNPSTVGPRYSHTIQGYASHQILSDCPYARAQLNCAPTHAVNAACLYFCHMSDISVQLALEDRELIELVMLCMQFALTALTLPMFNRSSKKFRRVFHSSSPAAPRKPRGQTTASRDVLSACLRRDEIYETAGILPCQFRWLWTHVKDSLEQPRRVHGRQPIRCTSTHMTGPNRYNCC